MKLYRWEYKEMQEAPEHLEKSEVVVALVVPAGSARVL
jgi:hypothetical protein